MKTTKQWMVALADGELYSASNAYSKADCIERHYSDTGEAWQQRLNKGDRIVRVQITVLKTLKK